MYYKEVISLAIEFVEEAFPRFANMEPKILHQKDEELMTAVFENGKTELRIEVEEKNEEYDFPHSKMEIRFITGVQDLELVFEGLEAFQPQQVETILKSAYCTFNAIATAQEDSDIVEN